MSTHAPVALRKYPVSQGCCGATGMRQSRRQSHGSGVHGFAGRPSYGRLNTNSSSAAMLRNKPAGPAAVEAVVLVSLSGRGGMW
eukprot:952104-Rhodomonas_salina.1